MPDEKGNTKADPAALPDTSLHAYGDDRDDQIKGDVDALRSDDPKQMQQDRLEGDDELELPHEKH
jgi:hypothetical protein